MYCLLSRYRSGRRAGDPDTEVPNSQMNSGCHNRSPQPSLLQLCDVREIDPFIMRPPMPKGTQLARLRLCEVSEHFQHL